MGEQERRESIMALHPTLLKVYQFLHKNIFVISIVSVILLFMAMQFRGAGIFGDFGQFYFSGYYYFHDDTQTYSFGTLFDLMQITKDTNFLNKYLPHSFRYLSPPNTSPFLYLMLAPLFFMPYELACTIFMWLSVFLSMITTYYFAKKYELDFKVMLFLLLFSFSFITNIQISQVGLYIYSIVLGLYITDNKWVKLFLLAVLINLKVFFGLVIVLFFIRKEYKNMIATILATILLAIISFKGDINLVKSYIEVLHTNLPIRIAYNQSIAGFVGIFTENRIIFFIWLSALLGLLLYTFKKQGNHLNVIYYALLLNPLSLIYYNSVYLIMIMFLYKQDKIRPLLYYMLINVPMQLTGFNTIDVLKVMPYWYVTSMVFHIVGLILILKYSSEKYINIGIAGKHLHILNFDTTQKDHNG